MEDTYYWRILIIGGYLLLEDTYYYREILIIGGSVAISSVIKVTMEQSGYSCTAKNMESHFTYSRMWTRHLLVQEDMRFFIFRKEGEI